MNAQARSVFGMLYRTFGRYLVYYFALVYLVFGLILVGVMLLRPQGLLPSRAREEELTHAAVTEVVEAES